MQKQKPARVLGLFSLIVINIIAVDSLRTLAISAEYGFSIISYYAIAALGFFIPIALVTAELATAWPTTGGLYIWIREAFGKHWAFLAIWLQWIYNIVWYPTILAFMAATLAYVIDPSLAENKTYLLITILTIFWATTWLNCLGMKASSRLSALGAIFGTILPMLIIISLAITWIISGNQIQISMTTHDLVPNLTHANHLAFMVAILFGLIGLEMSAVHAEEVIEPQRHYPQALLISAIIILISLILSSLAIAIVTPRADINLVSGLINAFNTFFIKFNMAWMTPIMALAIFIGGVSGVGAWIIGPTKGLMVASQDGNLPKLFAHTNRKGAPSYILIAQGIIFTLLCGIFLLMPTINSSYWILSALTAQLALLVYILLFAAAIRLRYKKPEVKRSFKIPGGKLGICLVGSLGFLSCLGAIIVGFFPPSQIQTGSVEIYESILIIGLLVFCLTPYIIQKIRSN